MKLTTLKHRLAVMPSRVQPLTTEAVNPRPRGRGWMETRRRIQARDHSMCADCGLLWVPWRDHVDHDTPRERGGSDDDSNLKLRCVVCHKKKTAAEAKERGG